MPPDELAAALQENLTSGQLEALVEKTTLADLLMVDLPGTMDPELRKELVYLKAQLETLADRLDRQKPSKPFTN